MDGNDSPNKMENFNKGIIRNLNDDKLNDEVKWSFISYEASTPKGMKSLR